MELLKMRQKNGNLLIIAITDFRSLIFQMLVPTNDNELQLVVQRVTTNDNEWQTIDNECYNLWQRVIKMTTSVTEQEGIITCDKE